MNRSLTPREQTIFRCLLVVGLPFMMIWNVGKTAIVETRSAWWFILHEPKAVWAEWIDAYRRGQP